MGQYAKGIVAALTALAAIGTELLSMGVLPANVAHYVTIGVAVVGAVLVYFVPNGSAPAAPKQK